jgi:hypothetical protein
MGHHPRYNSMSQLIEEERGQATVSLVDMIVGHIEFNTAKVGRARIKSGSLDAQHCSNNEPTRTEHKKT